MGVYSQAIVIRVLPKAVIFALEAYCKQLWSLLKTKTFWKSKVKYHGHNYSQPLTLSLFGFSKLVSLESYFDKLTRKKKDYGQLILKKDCTSSCRGGPGALRHSSMFSHETMLVCQKLSLQQGVLPSCYFSRVFLNIFLRFSPLIECL